MNIEDLVLFTYDAYGGEIRGRTMLQKILYFVSVFLDQDLGYEAHYYGPYSKTIAEKNNDLTVFGYLKETITPWGFSTSGFEAARHDYSLTDEAKDIIGRKKKKFQHEWDKIEQVVNKIKSSGEDLDYIILSVAAKAYYILKKENRKTSIERIKEIASSFNWAITDDQFERAFCFLEKIELIAAS